MVAADPRMTIGEVGRRIERLEHDLETRFDGLHRRLDDLTFVPMAVFEEARRAGEDQRRDLVRRVVALEDANRWLWRTVGGGVFLAVLGGIYAAAGLPK